MLNGAPLMVPLATPFTDDSMQISEVRMARQVRHHLEHGAAGFLLGGETGEWWALSLSERKTLVTWLLREAPGVPLLVHVGHFLTGAVLDLAQFVGDEGAIAILTPPPGVSLTESELQGLCLAMRRHGRVPFAALDPTGTLILEGQGSFVEPLSTLKLDSLGFSRSTQLEECVWGGRVCHWAAVMGADRFRRMTEDWTRARTRLHALHRIARGARLAKAAMQEIGLDLGPPRPPMMGADDQVRSIIRSLIADFKG